MVKSCDSTLALRREAIELAIYSLARAAAHWIDHGYEGTRLEEQ